MKLQPQKSTILLNHKEAAVELGISENTLRTELHALGIPYIVVGKHRMYSADALRQWAVDKAAESTAPVKLRRRA